MIRLDKETCANLWDGVYFKGSTYELNGDTFTHIKKINTSEYSDGESWDYILQRGSDGKMFRLPVWDAGEHNGYIFNDGNENTLEEVFPRVGIDVDYE